MSYSIWKKCALACVLAAAPSVYAVDGVVLIDQAHALAGNITPGDAPGFPITISQPGSYKLSGNLTVPDASTNAIQIAADSVTIDLNGFTISGPVACQPFAGACPATTPQHGISADVPASGNPAPRGTKISNGTVRGMGGYGIFLQGDGSSVDHVVATDNANGGFLVNGRVSDSAAVNNGNVGIFTIIVLNSLANENHGTGIQVDASGGVAIGDVASFNGGLGMSLPNGSAFNNTIVRNGSFGITTICPSVISGNTIVSDTGGTIQIT